MARLSRTTVAILALAILAISLLSQPRPAYAGFYNRSAAVSYADQWSTNGSTPLRNSSFPDWPNDCTNFAGQVLIAGGYPQNGSPNGQSGCYPSYFWQPYSFLGLWHWPWTWSVAECQRQMFANRPNDFYLYSGSPVNLNAGGDILQIGSSSGATTPDHSRILVGAGYDVMTGLWQSNLQDQHTTDEYHLVWDYNIDPSWTLWAWWVTW